MGCFRNFVIKTYTFVFEKVLLPVCIIFTVLLAYLLSIYTIKLLSFITKGTFSLVAGSDKPFPESLLINVAELVLGAFIVCAVALLGGIYLKVLNADCNGGGLKKSSSPVEVLVPPPSSSSTHLNLDDDENVFYDKGDVEMKGAFD